MIFISVPLKITNRSSSSVFYPRADPSLQTQAPRLQFYPKAGLPLQTQVPRLQFYYGRIGVVASCCFPHPTLSLASEQTLKDPRDTKEEVRRVNLTNWALRTSPQGLNISFIRGFWPDQRSRNPNHPFPPMCIYIGWPNAPVFCPLFWSTRGKLWDALPGVPKRRWGEWIWLTGPSGLHRKSPHGLNISSIRVFDQIRDPGNPNHPSPPTNSQDYVILNLCNILVPHWLCILYTGILSSMTTYKDREPLLLTIN